MFYIIGFVIGLALFGRWLSKKTKRDMIAAQREVTKVVCIFHSWKYLPEDHVDAKLTCVTCGLCPTSEKK